MTNLVAEFGSATAADQVQSEMRGDRHTRYGRHDRFELPLDHGPALRFYVRNLLVPHSRLEFLCSSVARSSPRTLLSLLRLRDSGDRRNGHVHSLLTKALNHAGVPAPERLSFITLHDYNNSDRQKNVIFIFGSGETPLAVAKVSSNPRHVAAMQHEHEALSRLRTRPEVRDSIPEPIGFLEEQGFTVLIEKTMRGCSMYAEARNAWSPRSRTGGHFVYARDWLVRFHKATLLEEVRLDAQLLREHVVQPFRDFARSSNPSPELRRLFAQTASCARRLKGTRLPVAARQGDFWARNLIVSSGQVSVVDWEAFSERSLPFHDLFLFAASYGSSFPWKFGRWASPVTAFRATFLDDTWLSRIVRGYLEQYCDEVGVSPALLNIFFPAFLAEQALRGRETSGRLLEEFAANGGSYCFGIGQ